MPSPKLGKVHRENITVQELNSRTFILLLKAGTESLVYLHPNVRLCCDEMLGECARAATDF